MRRALELTINVIAPLIVLWVMLTTGGITLDIVSSLAWLFIAAAWLAWRTARAVGDVRAIVHERRRADPLTTYRIGSAPVRPDAVANQAA